MPDPRPPLLIGACEWVALPQLGIGPLRARVDTGARSCALHATNQEVFEKDGQDWVRFVVHLGFDGARKCQQCAAPLVGLRRVKNTSGEIEERFTINTAILIGDYQWEVDITLTNRERMRYRMLLGRQAMKHHAIVYPGHTFLQGKPQLHRD